MKLRHDLPFRRIAVVLSGGGAYGAYEAGVLRTLTAVGLQPAVVAGVSVGALNGVAWVAHAGDTGPLEQAWRTLRPERLGIRWAMLVLRGAGGFLIVLGAMEALLVLAGYPVNVVAERLSSLRQFGGYLRATDTIEFLAWVLIATLGGVLVSLAPRLDDTISQGTLSGPPERMEHMLAAIVICAGALYVLVAALGLPWPLRLHFVAWTIALLGWLSLRAAPLRTAVGRLWLRLTPETGGRGTIIARPSRSWASLMISGGLTKKVFQRTKVNRPFSRKNALKAGIGPSWSGRGL